LRSDRGLCITSLNSHFLLHVVAGQKGQECGFKYDMLGRATFIQFVLETKLCANGRSRSIGVVASLLAITIGIRDDALCSLLGRFDLKICHRCINQ